MSSRLEKELTYVLKEQQIKLGFCPGKTRLYYPTSSLMRMLGVGDEEALAEKLDEELKALAEHFGAVEILRDKRRFCLVLSEQAVKYVKENVPDEGFLCDLIRVAGTHHCTMEEVLAVFRRYSDDVVCEDVQGEDYDHLVYFADGTPDDNYYCFTEEGHHLIYHRFAPEEFAETFRR